MNKSKVELKLLWKWVKEVVGICGCLFFGKDSVYFKEYRV